MNIKFENIIDHTVRNIKESWLAILGYNLLIWVLLFIPRLILTVFIIVLVIVMFGISFSAQSILMFYVILILAILILLPLWLPLVFISKTSSYIVARKLIYEEDIFTSMKKVITFDNIREYLVRVALPCIGIGLGDGVILFLASGASNILILLVAILLIILSVAVAVYIYSFFYISLCNGPDIKKNRIELMSRYSKRQIFLAYLIPFSMFLVIRLGTSILKIIPILGLIAGIIIRTLFSTSITKAMISEVNQLETEKVSLNTNNVIIKSDCLAVTVNSYGAQITSVKKGEKEIMWQADPEYWGKTAPILFPFVGRLKDDQYQAGGNTIKMNQHGFLRDRTFTLVAQDTNSATFEYTSTLADFNIYPVDFTVQITYRVFGSSVTTNYKVVNNSNYPMPYQIGGHPGFNVSSIDDLVVEFAEQNVTKHYFRDGLQTKTEPTELSTLKLSYDLINQNIPCYSDFKDKKLTIKQNGIDFLKFDFESMNYLAIWSPEYKNAKFICIEPWNGICSREDQPGYLLEDKDGMNVLAANSSEVCSYTFEVC